ncbi:extracellular solute-binding protein [Dethiothermospora halolimnae]|uniref:extracellular solute-binding protein n=1 Tax=Dethiothermospora halolimnae TaxID=3114390 RepID=UPI003CCBBA34
MKKILIKKNGLRKILTLFISIIFIFNLTGCDGKKKEENNEVTKGEITIAVWNKEMFGSDVKDPIIGNTMVDFQNDTGVEVSYDIIYANTYNEYLSKLNAKLYSDNGPTLIYFPNRASSKRYIEAGVALDVTNKIDNLEKVYDIFNDDKVHFIAVGMYYPSIVLNKGILDRLDIEPPDGDWDKKDFLSIREKWLNVKERHFNFMEYLNTIVFPYNELDIIDKEEKVIKLNNDTVKNFIINARDEIFSGNYKLLHDSEFYHKAFFYRTSDEAAVDFRDMEKYIDENLVIYDTQNVLKVQQSARANENRIVLPNIYDRGVYTYGFIVNKKGKNRAEGLEFVNRLLSNKNQIRIYEDQIYWFYPVNSEVGGEIEKIDKRNGLDKKYITMRNKVLNKIKKEEDIRYSFEDLKTTKIKSSIKKEFFKIIFSEEEYTDEKLERKLKQLENEYSLLLTE